MSITSIWLDVQGLRIHCLAAGEGGSPVVLLHGGGIDSASLSWGAALEALAATHRVFAPDLPGYGQSAKPEIQYTTEFYVDFLVHLLEALQLPKASLVGLSLGGAITLGFALEYPDRVDQLVIVDPYGIMPRVAWHKFSYLFVISPFNELSARFVKKSKRMVRSLLLSTFISNPARLSKALVDELYQAMQEPGAGKAWTSYQRYELSWNGVRHNYLKRLPEIHVPTLFINGEKDTVVPMVYAREAHTQVKNSQLYIMSECKHWPMRDKPEEFNRVVAEFLSK